jgi:hypothetical protein
MSNTDPIEDAARCLGLALEALEEATERRCAADRAERNLAHALGNDRARLASGLDDATTRVRALETVHREIAQRIDRTIETIRGALERGEQAPDNSTKQ